MADCGKLNDDILSLLCCPEHRMRLLPANDETLWRVNAAIQAGQLLNRVGNAIESPLDGGLVREDGTLMYPVIDGIPVLLCDDAILLEQLGR